MESLAHFLPTPEIIRLIAEIDEAKGRWHSLGDLAPDRLAALRRVATIESVGSSTRIEGSRLSDSEVETLLEGLETRSFRSRDEEEVAGYADAMETIFDSWREIVLTENHVKQLHQILLRHSASDERHRGKYKNVDNNIEAFDAEGRSLGVIFETATPFETPLRMRTLVDETSSALQIGEHHPLLVVSVFIVRFLAIHPFQDGNGRLSRVLTTLLLLRAGYGYVPYSSLERVIEENKSEYYRALRSAQLTLDRGEERLGDWIAFFLRCLVRQKDLLQGKIEQERRYSALPELSERLIAIAKQGKKLTVRVAANMTGENRNTIKVHLKQLVDEGHLVRHGVGRGTWYALP